MVKQNQSKTRAPGQITFVINRLGELADYRVPGRLRDRFPCIYPKRSVWCHSPSSDKCEADSTIEENKLAEFVFGNHDSTQ